jgi:hypothetical protein
LHTLPSPQPVPFGSAGFWQPATGSHESLVQGLPSLQVGVAPGVHAPAWQVSAPLQAFPSLQPVPLATSVFWQPLAASHESVVQGLPSLQLSGGPGVQVPVWQVSVPLQALPSPQDVPFVTLTFRHPSVASQESAVQGLPSSQLGIAPGEQVPAWQVSVPLHALPSLQDVPFPTAVCAHPVTGSQVSVVQGLLSSQSREAPGEQVPDEQVSAPLQTSPSGQEVPSARSACSQPVTGSQVSLVHAFESSQSSGAPLLQAPAWQVSAPLQTLPSPHAVPSATSLC